MRMHTRAKRIRCGTMLLLMATASCATHVRVPLAVPLPSIGGSRPATPQGFQLILDFGDGLWGQEQARAEMRGLGFAAAARDRGELGVSTHASTRKVRDPSGGLHAGEGTTALRARLRIVDVFGGRGSLGVHASLMSSSRERSDVQNERLTGLDLALPLELYPLGTNRVNHVLGIYVGPRLVRQTFTDHMNMRSRTGTALGAALGLVARWRFLSLSGELNALRTPDMMMDGPASRRGWIVLPAGSARAMLPLGP